MTSQDKVDVSMASVHISPWIYTFGSTSHIDSGSGYVTCYNQCCCCWVMSDSLQPHEPQHARPPCPSSTPRAYPNSCPLSWWCHPTISSSVTRFSSCPQPFPASGSFPMSQFFTSGGQSIGASASVLPMSIQGWFPWGLTGLISLLSKGLSRVFSSTSVWKHQFLSIWPSLWSNSQHAFMTTGKIIGLCINCFPSFSQTSI